MISKERLEYSNEFGGRVEQMFVSACQKVGYVCEKTDDNTDMYLHIDYIVYRNNNTKTSVDVKGGNHPNVIWVEFKNVNGNDGWMFGSAEIIAFDMPELFGFCIVNRKELLEWCYQNVEKVFVVKKEATRKLYQRKDRKDVISRLELSDIQKLSSYRLLKYNQ
jgi:hypothetical protein